MSTEEKDPNDMPLTWAGLKELANSLTEEQLKQVVKVNDNGCCTVVNTACEISYDTYNIQGYDTSVDDHSFEPEDFDNKFESLQHVLANTQWTKIPANTVYLFTGL